MKPANLLAASLLFGFAIAPTISAQSRDPQASPKAEDRIAREVRHELVTQPYYTVFDNLAYQVNGYTVTLEGQVTNPVLKSDAEKSVKKIEGVQNVIDNIEVLPVSPMDYRIRRAVYRAVYAQP